MNSKFSFISSLVFSILLTYTSLPAQSLNKSQLGKKVDTLMDQAIEVGEHVGLTAGIYADGEIAYLNGAGMRDRESASPAEGGMLHRIASISKPMTAVAALQLVEQGKLDLDVPIQTYLPEFPKKPEGDITTRHLLTHTSGINHYKGTLDGVSFKEYPTLLDAMKKFKDRKLIGVPGKVYRYSTYGYVVLGAVIEKVSGMDYESYMKKHVWEPAGMLNTSAERKGGIYSNKSALYKRTDKGKLKKDFRTNITVKLPGGGIQSNAKDLLLFGKAILDNKLLKPETLDLMLEDPGIRQGGNPYAMGWFLYRKSDEKYGRIIGHSGSQSGTSTQLMIMLDKGIVITGISNTRGAWGNVLRMTWQMIDLATQPEMLVEPIPQFVELNKQQMDRLLGTYDFGGGQILTIKRKGDKLYSRMNKYSPLQLYPESETKVHYRNVHAWFDFEFDDAGNISKTTYFQNGQLIYPKKIE